jgi:hypothetical protein
MECPRLVQISLPTYHSAAKASEFFHWLPKRQCPHRGLASSISFSACCVKRIHSQLDFSGSVGPMWLESAKNYSLIPTSLRQKPKEERMRGQIEKLHKIMADAPRLAPDRSREEVFGRYTVRAYHLIFFARHFASYFGSPVVESEHILLSVVREGRDHFELFFPFADSKDTVYKKLEGHFTPGGTIDLSGKIVATKELPPLSEQCRQVLSLADEEATTLRSEHIAPEHLLLGMLREKDSYAAIFLREYGAELERIRKGLAA